MIRYLKPMIAALLLFTLLAVATACGGPANRPSGGGIQIFPWDEPDGTEDHRRPIETDPEGHPILGAPISETETESAAPEPTPLLAVSTGTGTFLPNACYTWTGDRGTDDGAAGFLPMIAGNLPILYRGDTLTFLPRDGAEVAYVRIYDDDFEEYVTEREGAEALFDLPTGLWSAIVGVTYEEEGSPCGTELAFRISVGVRVFFEERGTVTIPKETLTGTSTYDPETDTWTTQTGLAGSVPSEGTVPTLTLGEDLRFETLGGYDSFSVTVFDLAFEEVKATVSSLDELYNAVPSGEYYAVITVEWTNGYVESYGRYETETCEYTVKLLLP